MRYSAMLGASLPVAKVVRVGRAYQDELAMLSPMIGFDAHGVEWVKARSKRKHMDKPKKRTNRSNISARVRRKHRRAR